MILIALGAFMLAVLYCLAEVFYERDWPRYMGRWLALMLFLLLCTVSVFGQGVYFSNTAKSVSRTVPIGSAAPILTMPFAKINVCAAPAQPLTAAACQNRVTAYSDVGLTQPLPQPLTADAQGNFNFYLPPGQYAYTASNQQGQWTLTSAFTLTGFYPSALTVPLELFVGTTIDQKVNAAQAAYPNTPITMVVNTAGTMPGSVNLTPGNSMLFLANVTFGTTANNDGSFYVYGNNHISCGPGVVLSTPHLDEFYPFISAVKPDGTGGDWIEIDHCHAQAPAGSAAGLFRTQGTNHHRFHDNQLTDIAGIITALTPDDVQVFNNYIIGTGPGLAPASLMGMIGGGKATNFLFHGNTCKNVIYCGFVNPGDAGSVGTRADAKAYGGNHVFSGNSCDTVFSCTWTGPGENIVMSGNTCRHALDQCYDLEGDIDSSIVGNVAYNDSTVTGGGGLNASASLFRFSDNNSIIGNEFTHENGAAMIVFKNSSADPVAFLNTMVKGNTLSCKTVACDAIYTEAATGTRFVDNTLTDATVSLATLTVNGSINPEVSRNSQTFSIKTPYAIRIKTDYGRAVIEDNKIQGEVAEDAGTVGIDVVYTYGNLFPSVVATGNKQLALFPVDLRMNNTSTNPALGADATFSGNWARSNNVVYNNPNSRPGTFKELSRFIPDGARNWKQTFPYLSGSGNGFYCVDTNGAPYRSATACTP